MIQSIRRPSGQCFGLLIFCLATLVMPPQMLAAALDAPISLATTDRPDFFTATFPDTGQTLQYFAQPDGSLDLRSTDGSQMGHVPSSVLDEIKIIDLVEDGRSFDSTFTVPDGLGGANEYRFYGSWDGETGLASGILVTPDGVSRVVEVAIPADNASGLAAPNTKAVQIVIVIGAGAVIAGGCFILALITNCTRDCTTACTAAGGSLKSAKEGFCGRCTCTCFPPPPPTCQQQRLDDGKAIVATPSEPTPTCEQTTFEALAIPFSAVR